MKEIKFIMKEIFPPDDNLAIWILTLSRIYNDLIIVNSRMVDLYEKNIYSESEMIYFSRLGFSHYREALKFINLYKNKSEIRDFLSNLDKELINKYNFILSSSNPYKGSFLEKHVVPIRNNMFHYNNEKKLIKEIIEKKEGYESMVRIVGHTMKGIDLVYADEISVFLSFNNMEMDDFINFVKEISNYIFALIDFLDGAIAAYFTENILKTEVVELDE